MIRWKCHVRVLWVVSLLLLPLSTGTTRHDEDNDDSSLEDLNLDDINDTSLGDDFADNSPPPMMTSNLPVKEQFEMMKRAVRVAMRRPGGYAHLAQVLPILRVMTGPQRLAFATFVLKQIAASPANNDEPALKMVSQLAGDNNSTNDMVPKLLLPLSADIAHLFRGVAHEMAAQDRSGDAKDIYEDHFHAEARSRGGSQVLPLWRGQTPERRNRPLQPPRRIHNPFPQPVINRRNSHITDMLPPPPPQGHIPPPMHTPTSPPAPPMVSRTPKPKPVQNSCELFSDGVCLSVQFYPEEAIRQSIREDHVAAQALTTDPAAFNLVANEDKIINRRKDEMEDEDDSKNTEGATLCPSKVVYARPQRARATSGQWKYIVNTAEHSQTLRLEKCTKPNDSCTYISDKLLSRCTQVYNYHRLLTWDKEKGLHIDIFKVPSCCSCRIFSGKRNPASIFLTSASSPNEAEGAFSNHDPSVSLRPHFETSALHESVGSNSVHQRVPSPDERQNDDPYQYMGPTKTSWPFRKPATLRPANLHLDSVYELSEDPTAEDLVPPSTYTPQTDLRRITVPYTREPQRSSTNRPHFHPPGGRLPSRNRTRPDSNDPPDLTAEGTQRRPYPLILAPESISRPSQFATLPSTTSTTPAPRSAAPTTQGPRRVNYSYHPIIEFFRPEQRVPVQQPRLAGRSSGIPAGGAPLAAAWTNENGWNPITSGPLGVTPSHLTR